MASWTVARQAPLSVEFSRQEYWSGLPCPPPGDLPDSGAGPASLLSPALAGRFFIATPSGKSPGSRQLWLSLHPLNVELIALGIGNCFTGYFRKNEVEILWRSGKKPIGRLECWRGRSWVGDVEQGELNLSEPFSLSGRWRQKACWPLWQHRVHGGRGRGRVHGDRGQGAGGRPARGWCSVNTSPSAQSLSVLSRRP